MSNKYVLREETYTICLEDSKRNTPYCLPFEITTNRISLKFPLTKSMNRHEHSKIQSQPQIQIHTLTTTNQHPNFTFPISRRMEDDQKWQEATEEAGTWASSVSLRKRFLIFLLFCEIAKPAAKKWNQINRHWRLLCDNILHPQLFYFVENEDVKPKFTKNNKHLIGNIYHYPSHTYFNPILIKTW